MDDETESVLTYYVGPPGSGTLAGGLRQVGWMGVAAVVAAVPVGLALQVLHDPAPWVTGALLLVYCSFLVVAALYLRAPTRVEVGPEGMRASWHRSVRVFPLASILGVSTSVNELTVFLDEARVGQRAITFASRRRLYPESTGYSRSTDQEIARLSAAVSLAIDDFARRNQATLPARTSAAGG